MSDSEILSRTMGPILFIFVAYLLRTMGSILVIISSLCNLMRDKQTTKRRGNGGMGQIHSPHEYWLCKKIIAFYAFLFKVLNMRKLL